MIALAQRFKEAQATELETSEPQDPFGGIQAIDGDEFHSGKIYCANCIHCKLIPVTAEKEDRYLLRIRCAAGKWKKKLGEEKLYKYCTITRRYLDCCDAYEEMGDTREFIRELRKQLSNKDELFNLAAAE
jgi:hypothetical protein